MALKSGISVVIPVYNSENILSELIKRLDNFLSETPGNFEIILVNDGSTDASWETIIKLREQYGHLRGINMMRNYGQHNALLCGIRAAEYDLTLTMDDDLQHPPTEISKLLAKLDDSHDVVYGPPIEPQNTMLRNSASRLTRVIFENSMGTRNARMVSAFRVFRTRLREAFAEFNSPYVSIDILLTWGTNRFSFVPVHYAPRYMGNSTYSFRKLFQHAFDLLTGFSTLPLQVASLVGFGFTLFGFGVLVYVLGRYVIEGGSWPGFPFLASTIAIFSGAQLFALGVIGEYVGRIHFRSMNRPTYLVREEFGDGDEASNK
ncbi:MAG: glycosyltransferase family 2 protein [Anaerolineae bacterium]|nr:glycosyltransferase family 2 protein [Anaerolineae bacterium]